MARKQPRCGALRGSAWLAISQADGIEGCSSEHAEWSRCAAPCRNAVGSELRALAASLGAELVADPGGEVAALVAALFVGSEESVRSANSVRRQARDESVPEPRPLRDPIRRAG